MSAPSAAARPRRRRIYGYAVMLIAAYVALTAIATVILWRRKLIHDAVSLGSYATAVLAISTIVLFAATAMLAAATVDLVRAERDAARREEQKYELERGAREQEEQLRAQQSRVYARQIAELDRRLADQERAQAQLVRMSTQTVTLALPGGVARPCLIARMENRSHLPISNCHCTITLPDGTVEHARPGTLLGAINKNELTEFTSRPDSANPVIIDSGQHADFAFLTTYQHSSGQDPFVRFTDANGLAWQLDARLTLKRFPLAQNAERADGPWEELPGRQNP